MLVAVASFSSKKSEKFEGGKWSDIQEPPVAGGLSEYAVIFDSGKFYYFGGFDGRSHLSLIFCLNAGSWTWTNVGSLNSGRIAHGVIAVESMFMIIGGVGTQPNEACRLNNDKFTCEQKSSNLVEYARTPLLFLMNDNYGNC